MKNSHGIILFSLRTITWRKIYFCQNNDSSIQKKDSIKLVKRRRRIFHRNVQSDTVKQGHAKPHVSRNICCHYLFNLYHLMWYVCDWAWLREDYNEMALYILCLAFVLPVVCVCVCVCFWRQNYKCCQAQICLCKRSSFVDIHHD